MRFYILTLFPDMVIYALNTSVIGRAVNQGILEIHAVNIRDFSGNRHGKVDDYPYGGGAGMIMQPQPIYDAWEWACREIGHRPRCAYLTPQGTLFSQEKAEALAKERDLILLCGHYEGVDERVTDEIVTDYISIGDYVLTGGEIPAMVVADAISRMVPGVLSNGASGEIESLSEGLLEYPQYSRPAEWMGRKVPEVLLSGDHTEVERWRRKKSIEKTLHRRPELLKEAVLDRDDIKIILDEKKKR